jgi:hypothetical protein
MKPETEEQHQIAVMSWAEKQAEEGRPELALLFHIPNGGHRNRVTAIKLKAMGVKPGVSDLLLPVARGGYHGLWIEMKKPKGRKATEDQDGWLLHMKEQGYMTGVCVGFEEAKRLIEAYLSKLPAQAKQGNA